MRRRVSDAPSLAGQTGPVSGPVERARSADPAIRAERLAHAASQRETRDLPAGFGPLLKLAAGVTNIHPTGEPYGAQGMELRLLRCWT